MKSREHTILNGAAATGAGNPINVADFDHIVLHVDIESTPTGTVKFQGSASKELPDFDSAQANDNRWDYVQAQDLEDGSSIDGDDGIAVAGTAAHRLIEINVNHLEWFTANVTAYTAGAFYITGTLKQSS